MKNWTFLNRWIPRKNRSVQDSMDIEAMSRLIRNVDGFEEMGQYGAGGLQLTNQIIGTPHLVSPGFTGDVLNKAIIGVARSRSEYNFRDLIHLQLFGETYNEVLVDQTLVGAETVTVTGLGIVYYEIIWDGVTSPTITPGFIAGFVLPPNSDTVRHVPLAFVELGTDSNLLYLRQVQVGIIKEYFHECCEVGPEPGICPDDCPTDCSGSLPITVTIAGFGAGNGCDVLNGVYSLSSISATSDGCWHFMAGGAIGCNAPPGETLFNCPVDVPFANYRSASPFGNTIIGAMCCGGLWELHAYNAQTSCTGHRTARWFASPDAANNGCPPKTADWFLETDPNFPPCNQPGCVGCTAACCDSDCLQCMATGTVVTT